MEPYSIAHRLHMIPLSLTLNHGFYNVFTCCKAGELNKCRMVPISLCLYRSECRERGQGQLITPNRGTDRTHYGSLHCSLIIIAVILIYFSIQYPEHPVIPEAPKPNADTLENLQKQLNIEMQVKKGAENLILAYSMAPSKNKKHRKAAQRMHQDCVKKIQVLQTLILQVQKETCETSVSAPAPEEALEMDAITPLGAQLEEAPVKDIESILEKILEGVFEMVTDEVSSPVPEEATGEELQESPEKDIETILEKILEDVFEIVTIRESSKDSEPEEDLEMDAITPLGAELEEAPVKDIESILEKILEGIFEMVTDEVSSPVPEEATGEELQESPEKDIETILEKILEDVFEIVTIRASSPYPEPEEALEMDAITPMGAELEEAPVKDIESILEKILEGVFEMVTDEVSSPVPEEATGEELQESPEKDIETILVKILEDVFEIVTIRESSPDPEPEEALDHLSEPTPDIQIAVELPQETAVTPVIITKPEIPVSSMENIVLEDPELQHKISLQDFRCSAMLGTGGFGKVLLAQYKDSNRLVALKAQNKRKLLRMSTVDRILGEKEALQTISSRPHPFLVNIFASFQTDTHTIFVMEYVAGGDLEMQIKKSPNGLPKPRAVFYAACITLGVECLHQFNIVHRDLKAENIVIDREGFAKITDFGLCKTGMGFGDRTRSWCGSLPYMAPELVAERPYTRAVDWWSVGVLLYFMLAGKVRASSYYFSVEILAFHLVLTASIPNNEHLRVFVFQMPYTGKTGTQLMNRIKRAPVEFQPVVSKKGRALLHLLLEKTPSVRLGAGEKDAQEVKAHRFFKKINWDELLEKKVKPPFVPNISSPEDVSNFNKCITSRIPQLSPPWGGSLRQEDQDVFRGFDWITDGTL
uniref:Uncharacterized protein n=1 Tax=Leptobrachium leishanense TaxID=445787 RepID=A0A8C5Q0V5_9ANUR